MTYLTFILLFVLPAAAGACALALARTNSLPAGSLHSLIVLSVVALVYTIPWDRHLILSGVWGYPEGRVIGTFLSIPFEELAFIFLQTIGVGAWTLHLAGSPKFEPSLPGSSGERLRFERVRWIGIGCTLQITLFGILLLQIEGARYFGLLLSWAGPVLLLQVAVGGAILWKLRPIWALGILPPFLYLCVIDRVAIGSGIWFFSDNYTSGLRVLGLPLEEALFFFLTTAMVNQGVLLYTGILKQWIDRPAAAPGWSHRLAALYVKP
ncbi:MAG: lycopene cyclase domain-containing protein [Puniceicoccaceae bacterium]